MWNRSRRMPGSSSSGWKSRTSTESTVSRQQSPSSRRTRPGRSRSTVGTSTEVYDYLRLLWARVGRTFCPRCGRELKPDTVQSVSDRLLGLEAGARFVVAFPLKLSAKVTDAMVNENLRAQGFMRVVINGEMKTLEEVAEEKTSLTRAQELLVVVDRLSVDPSTSRDGSRKQWQRRSAKVMGTASFWGPGPGAWACRARESRVTSHESRAPLHRALRVPRRRFPRTGAHTAALLVQQPAWCLSHVQWLRRCTRVRRGPDRPPSRTHVA